MTVITFTTYAAISTLAVSAAALNSTYKYHQFYNIAVHLTSHKLNIVLLSNYAFMCICLLGKLLTFIFFNQLSRDELEDLVEFSKYSLTETCLALTIFRDEITLTTLALFVVLLFVKTFHWLYAQRVEQLARVNITHNSTHFRLISLCSALALVDTLFIYHIGTELFESRQANVLLLFGFEYVILVLSLFQTTCKYAIYCIDYYVYQSQWTYKSTYIFYLEFAVDIVRLVLYLCFFIIICTHYGLPLHLIRELTVTFYNIRERISKFIAYKQLTHNMNSRFVNATDAEIEQTGDRTCIICREDMNAGDAKKLSCNHIMHFHCLRMWLERSQSCPTCRREIPTNPQAEQRQQQQQAQQNNNNAPPAAQPAPPRNLLQQLALFFAPHRANMPAQQQPLNAAQQPVQQPRQLSLAEIAALHPPPQTAFTSTQQQYTPFHLPTLPLPQINPQTHRSDISALLPLVTASTAIVQTQLQFAQLHTSYLTDLMQKHVQYQQALQQYQQRVSTDNSALVETDDERKHNTDGAIT